MSQIKFVNTSSIVSIKIANIYDSVGDYSYSDTFDRYANLLLKIAQQEQNEEIKDIIEETPEETPENEHAQYIVEHPLAAAESDKLKSNISPDDRDFFEKIYNAWISGSTIKQSVKNIYDIISQPQYRGLESYYRDTIEKVVRIFYKVPNSSFRNFTDELFKGNLKFAEDELSLSLSQIKPEQIQRYDRRNKIDESLKYLPDGHAKNLFREYLYQNATLDNLGQIINDLMNFYDLADYFENSSEFESYINSSSSFDSTIPEMNKEEIVNFKKAGLSFNNQKNYYQQQLNIHCSNDQMNYFIKNINFFKGIQEPVQISNNVFDRLTTHYSPEQVRVIFDNIKSLMQDSDAENIIRINTILPFDQAIAKYKELQHDGTELNLYYKRVLGTDYELFDLEPNQVYQTLYLVLLEADKEKAEIYIGSLSDHLNRYVSNAITKSNAKYFLDYITKFDKDYVKQYFTSYYLSNYIKHRPDRLQEIHPVEIAKHNNPDIVLAYHKSNPEFTSLSVDDIEKYSEFYKNNSNAADIPYKELEPHIENNNVQNYILFGSTDPNKAKIADKIYKANSYRSREIAARFKDSDIIDVSKVGFLDISNPRFAHLSLTELSFLSDKVNHFETLEKIKSVKDSFKNPRNTAYHNFEEGSADYNKLLYIIFHNYDLRGRNPQLLIKLLDLHAKDKMITELSLYETNHMLRNRVVCDLPNIDLEDAKIHVNNRKHILNNIEKTIYSKYNTAIKIQNTEIAKYPLNQILDFVTKYDNALDTDEDAISYLPKGVTPNQAGEALQAINDGHGLLIYLNKESMVKFYKLILDKIIGINPDYSESAIKRLPMYAAAGITADINYYLPDAVTEDFIKEITSIQIPNKLNIDFSKATVRLNSNTEIEYVNESMALLRLFNKSLPNFLDKFIIASGKQYEKTIKFSEMDDYVQSIVIHDAAQKFDKIDAGPGLSDYIIQQMTNKNLSQLTKIARMWNKEINIADEKMNIASKSLVSELSKIYDVSELSDLVKTSSSLIFFSKIEVQEPKLAKEFDKHFEFSDKPDFHQHLGMDENDRLLKMYQNLEILYKHRDRFPQPEWSDIEEEYYGYTARFLHRNDTRGMFIGNYAGCCQHPDSYAATLALDGQISNKSSFFIIEDQRGQMILGSYVWEDDNGNICFDSFETIGSKLFGSVEVQKIADKLIYDVAQRMNTNVNFGSLSNGAYKPNRFRKNTQKPFINNAKPWENVYAKTILDLNSKEINSNQLYVADSESQIIIIQR
jgi:hypothetical protein